MEFSQAPAKCFGIFAFTRLETLLETPTSLLFMKTPTDELNVAEHPILFPMCVHRLCWKMHGVQKALALHHFEDWQFAMQW